MGIVAARKPKGRPLEEQLRESLRRDIQNAAESQNKLAELAGMDRTALSEKLSGKRPLTIDEAERLAKVLGKSLTDYIGAVRPTPVEVNYQQLRTSIGMLSTQWMRWVDQLERRGGTGRKVIPMSRRMPMIGDIAAGTPMLAEENWEGEVVFDTATHFLLHVHGESMIDAGIHDGDWVHVLKTDDYRDGDVVAARVKGAEEATVKYLHLVTQGRVLLSPANRRRGLMPEEYDAEDLEIEGKVLGAYRPIERQERPRLRRVAERKKDEH
jgi:SOS-response transcriptional repressor LexA